MRVTLPLKDDALAIAQLSLGIFLSSSIAAACQSSDVAAITLLTNALSQSRSAVRLCALASRMVRARCDPSGAISGEFFLRCRHPRRHGLGNSRFEWRP